MIAPFAELVRAVSALAWSISDRRSAAKLLSKDEARRIASDIAKLLELVREA